jgi:type I restriction enzyme S subunit
MVPQKTRIKYVVSKIGSGKTPHGGAEAYTQTGVMFLRSQNVHFDGLRLSDVVFIDDKTDAEMASTRVQPGDVLLNITGASLGRCAVVPPGMPASNVNQHVCILRSDQRQVLSHYLNIVLQSALVQDQIFSSENGSSREGLTFEQIGNFEIPIPSIEEQRSIVNYLDRELARLNGLVAAKEQSLTLLDEKLKALKTHAVIRGLNPDCPYHDSSVAWLGQIPAHWKVERSRWLFRERDERSVTGKEEMLTVSHLTGVTPRSEKDVNMFEAETTEGYKICYSGDLVINTLWAWMGAMGVSQVHGIVSPAYNVYIPGEQLNPSYVDILVRIPVFAQEAMRFSKGVWSSRLRLYPEGFFEIWMPVPPLEEQTTIIAHVTSETVKINALISSASKTIGLLRERRMALITRALTGQVKVNET